jgi:hypothetical protein
MTNIYIYSLLFLINTIEVEAQYKNDFQAGISNVAFGGVVGGIGAIINKKKTDKTGKTFLKGFYKGAIGGLLVFESKNMLKYAEKNKSLSYYWPSKILNSTGVSIIENAVANRGMLEQVHINFAFNRFDFYTKEKFRVQYRVLPLSLVSTIYNFSNYQFDIKLTLQTGTIFYYTKNDNQLIHISGVTLFNNVVLDNFYKTINPRFPYKYGVINHEITHVYQYETLFSFNGFLNKPLKNLEQIPFYKKYSKYIYPEYGQVLRLLFKTNKQDGFIEREAQYYSHLY